MSAGSHRPGFGHDINVTRIWLATALRTSARRQSRPDAVANKSLSLLPRRRSGCRILQDVSKSASMLYARNSECDFIAVTKTEGGDSPQSPSGRHRTCDRGVCQLSWFAQHGAGAQEGWWVGRRVRVGGPPVSARQAHAAFTTFHKFDRAAPPWGVLIVGEASWGDSRGND